MRNKRVYYNKRVKIDRKRNNKRRTTERRMVESKERNSINREIRKDRIIKIDDFDNCKLEIFCI